MQTILNSSVAAERTLAIPFVPEAGNENARRLGAAASAPVSSREEIRNGAVWEIRVRVRFDKASGALESHRGWIRDFYPIGPQTVRMTVPSGRRVTKVELLRAEKTVRFAQRSGAIEFTIPGVLDYEVAALYAG